MLRQAAADLNLDLGKSWLIGDTTTDVQTAKNAGVRSILVQTGYGGRDAKHAVTADATFPSLLEAADWITQND